MNNEINGIIYREARIEDAQPILSLVQQLGYETTSLSEIKNSLSQLLQDDNHYLLVAETPGGQIVGYTHVSNFIVIYVNYNAELQELCVDRNYKGRGIGKKLIDYVEKWAVQNGYDQLIGRTNVMREESHKFYKHLGFQFIKKQYCIYKRLTSN